MSLRYLILVINLTIAKTAAVLKAKCLNYGCEWALPKAQHGAVRCIVENQRSPRLSCCPSEVARVGGHGGRRLLTIWIVLLANLQQAGEALTDGRRVRAPWLGAWAGIPAGSSPIWVFTNPRDGGANRETGRKKRKKEVKVARDKAGTSI